MVANFAKIPNQGVLLCNALIPELEFKHYVNLWESTKKRKMELTLTYMQVSILEEEEKLSSSTEKLMVERNTRPKVVLQMEHYFESVGKSKSTHVPSNQCAINTAFQKMKHADLNSVNHARINMAVVMFFYEKNISDHALESLSFKIMLKYAHLLSQECKIPTRKGVSGHLLNINFNNIVENNNVILCCESDGFGLYWLSNGATIARMPLLKILDGALTLRPHVFYLNIALDT
jgi:hypothetical protein